MWVTVAGAFMAGSFIGWIVTAISCQPDSCVVAATGVGLVSGVVSALGVGVVVVLAIRSIGEWRDATAAGIPPPGPGCETGDE